MSFILTGVRAILAGAVVILVVIAGAVSVSGPEPLVAIAAVAVVAALTAAELVAAWHRHGRRR